VKTNQSLALCIVLSITIVGCGVSPSVPWPTNRNLLDKKAVEFAEDIPKVALEGLSLQSLRVDQSYPNTHVVVAASGGGARASAFTLGVLSELQQRKLGESSNYLREIDYFSSVSGGGWGVASYLTARLDVGPEFTMDDKVFNSLIKKYEKYEELRKDLFDCHSNSLEPITQGKKLSEMYAYNGEAPTIPYIIPNITIAENQSPFILSGEFVRKYQINSFSAESCEGNFKVDRDNIEKSIGNIPLYLSMAASNICNDEYYAKSFYCIGENNFSKLTLVDGGIFDNYGVMTAFDILSTKPKADKKILIVIDSNADATIPLNQSEGSNFSAATATGIHAGFPSKTIVIQKYLDKLGELQDVEVIYIGFSSLFVPENRFSEFNQDSLKAISPELSRSVEDVLCFSDDEVQLQPGDSRREKSKDCSQNNLYRAAVLHKTTYKFDSAKFKSSFHLGKIATTLSLD
jgi:hypothetical protein